MSPERLSRTYDKKNSGRKTAELPFKERNEVKTGQDQRQEV